MYLIASIINLPLFIYQSLSNGSSLLGSIVSLIRQTLFAGSTSSQLWYFPALLFAVFIIYIFEKKKQSLKKLLICALVLFIIGLFGGAYIYYISKVGPLYTLFNLYKKVFITTRNGLFVGLVFVLIGYLIRKHCISMQTKKLLLPLIIFVILNILEVTFIRTLPLVNSYNNTLTLLPLSVLLFIPISNLYKTGNTKYGGMLRDMSTTVFIVHYMIMSFLQIFIESNLVVFVLTTLTSIIIAYAVYAIKREHHQRQNNKIDIIISSPRPTAKQTKSPK